MQFINIKNNLTNPLIIERIVAFALDITICLILNIIPVIGWIAGLLYFLLKDSLPFTNYGSFGKHIYKLSVIDLTSKEVKSRIQIEKSIIRSLVILIPIINIIDIIQFLNTGRRLADEWTTAEVVKIEESEDLNIE